jgi:hypothetical protein
MTAFLGAMPGGQLGFDDYLSGVAARVGLASAVAVPGHLVD